MIILLLIIFGLGGFWLITGLYVWQIKREGNLLKTKAYSILKNHDIPEKEVKKIIKKLSAYQYRHDTKAKELVRKLMEL